MSAPTFKLIARLQPIEKGSGLHSDDWVIGTEGERIVVGRIGDQGDDGLTAIEIVAFERDILRLARRAIVGDPRVSTDPHAQRTLAAGIFVLSHIVSQQSSEIDGLNAEKNALNEDGD